MQMDTDRPQLTHSNSSSNNGVPQAELEQAPLLLLTHSVKVNAVHRLWSNALPENENVKRFGQGIHVHGHEYFFQITFRGPVCRATGQMMGLDLLEDVVGMSITEVIDRKNLDTDISFFLSRPSTLENVCLFVWRNITVIMRPHPFQCEEVRVRVAGCYRGPASRGLDWSEAAYRGEMTTVNSKNSI